MSTTNPQHDAPAHVAATRTKLRQSRRTMVVLRSEWPAGSTADRNDVSTLLHSWAVALRLALDHAFQALVVTVSPTATPAQRALGYPVCSTASSFAEALDELSFLPPFHQQRVEESQPFCCPTGPEADPLQWLTELTRPEQVHTMLAACDHLDPADPARRTRSATSVRTSRQPPWEPSRTAVMTRLDVTGSTVTTLVDQLAHDRQLTLG